MKRSRKVKEPDTKFMREALRLARKGEGAVSPNPLVGAVIVKNGKIIGRGWHRQSGLAHAEIEALEDCKRKGNSARGAKMYVNLEPCARKYEGKKTPPCCEAIIKSGISEVVMGCEDPNPKAGGGGALLRKNGISVKKNILRERCEDINEIFFKHIKTGLPFVILKLSASVDGKIATRAGDSKWIGNDAQRKIAHGIRKKCDSVLVGIETVLKDNPRLDARLVKTVRQPACVVADTNLRIPPDAKLLGRKNVIIAVGAGAEKKKIKLMQNRGIDILTVGKSSGRGISMRSLMKKLSRKGIKSVLIEGGGAIAASALREKIVDKMVFFYSPLIIGGDGKDMVAPFGINLIKNTLRIKLKKTKTFSETLMLEAYPEF